MSRLDETLREVCETLAPLRRRAGSDDERRAAEWLAERLTAAGARAARVEDAPFHPGYAKELLPLNGIALGAGILARHGRRPVAAALAAAAGAAVADDASNLTRVWRNTTTPERTTTNVIAETGNPDSDRTLVVLAHHDAAPTGLVFDPRPQAAFAKRFPEVVAKTDTSAPLWWPVIGGPLLIALGAATGRTGITKAGLGLAAISTGLALDIARSPVVPGANDNLSAVAALVALAEHGDFPVRVLLASCGAEEVLQGGIYHFTDTHLKQLDPERTWVLNLDTIGSPELFMLEGEGILVMEDYTEPAFRDRIAAVAERSVGTLRRGCRARSSTDSVIPSRAGYPTACLCSWEPTTKALSNYHLMTDTPENLHYDTIARAVRLAIALAEDLGT